MKQWLVGLVLVAALPALGVGGDGDLFPQHVGDSHTYHSLRGDWTDQITAVHDGYYDHSNYWRDNVVHSLNVSRAGDVVDRIKGEPHLWYRFSDTPDKPWTMSLPGNECADGCTIKFGGIETVTVPAGTFEGCVKLLFRGHCNDAGPLAQWFAPHVGLVRLEEDSYTGRKPSVLTAARVGDTSYP